MLDVEIRKYLNDYLDGKINRHQLEEWFVPATWDVDICSSESARALAYEIEALLDEFTSEALTEEELRGELKALVPKDLTITIGPSADRWIRTSSSAGSWQVAVPLSSSVFVSEVVVQNTR